MFNCVCLFLASTFKIVPDHQIELDVGKFGTVCGQTYSPMSEYTLTHLDMS